MIDFVISGHDVDPISVRELAARIVSKLPARPQGRIVLYGRDQLGIAALAVHALAAGSQVVLWPFEVAGRELPLEASIALGLHHGSSPSVTTADALTAWHDQPWNVALYSSGSTRTARPFGFGMEQIGRLTRWYQSIYEVGSSSAIVTALPVAYNFTFVAGICLAAAVGGRLHLASSPEGVPDDARALAVTHDRCVILANPVQLQLMSAERQLPPNVLIDTGGAPLSTSAIRFLRNRIADVREGYGLTENGSLTHFDMEGTEESIGTVGTAMSGVRTEIVELEGKPRIAIHSPAVGVAIRDETRVGPLTGDIGAMDSFGRLRLLGRDDDFCVAGSWPRDTLDLIGPVLGARCARVQQPSEDEVNVLLMGDANQEMVTDIRDVICGALRVSSAGVSISCTESPGLHSAKLARARRHE